MEQNFTRSRKLHAIFAAPVPVTRAAGEWRYPSPFWRHDAQRSSRATPRSVTMQQRLPDDVPINCPQKPRSALSKIVTGSSLQPLSSLPPKQIVLLLHGYCSNGVDLISLAAHWRQALPDALFLAPNAPERCGVVASGYQWRPLSTYTQQALASGAHAGAPAINAFIDRKLDQYGLGDTDLAIVGFSQGTMMALHVGLRRQTQVAGIVGYSGILTGIPELARTKITKPPVLLVHGSSDPVVPVGALLEAERILLRLGVNIEAHMAHGIGHGIDPVGLRVGAEFLERTLTRGKQSS